MATCQYQTTYNVMQQQQLSLAVIPEDESISYTKFDTETIPQSKIDPHQEDRDISIALTNSTRMDAGEAPLGHSDLLDDLACLHAESMAAMGRLQLACDSAETLQGLLDSDDVACNVQRGYSVLEMHTETMTRYGSNRDNIFATRFNEYGVGFAWGEDGYLYCCQYFRSKPW